MTCRCARACVPQGVRWGDNPLAGAASPSASPRVPTHTPLRVALHAAAAARSASAGGGAYADDPFASKGEQVRRVRVEVGLESCSAGGGAYADDLFASKGEQVRRLLPCGPARAADPSSSVGGGGWPAAASPRYQELWLVAWAPASTRLPQGPGDHAARGCGNAIRRAASTCATPPSTWT